MAVVAAFAGIVGLAVSVFLSPLFAVLFLIAFLVFAAAFVIRLLRRRPVLRWGLAGGACFVLMLAFSGVSAALYGGRRRRNGRPDPREGGEATRAARGDDQARRNHGRRDDAPARENVRRDHA